MKLSVALCTYNGEQHLSEQLESIRQQTRLPDELVVCDDASRDHTLAIVQKFVATVTFPTRVESNQTNLGTTRNFEKAIGLCTGEVIVLTDQDDVWLPHKLATLEAELTSHPEAGFVFSDADIVDERLNPCGYSLWEAVGFSPRDQSRFRRGGAFETLVQRHRVTGATMAFQARYRDLISPIPPEWSHDAWIALMIAAVAPCVPIDQKLIHYRQHHRQQLGASKRGLSGEYRAARKFRRETCEIVSRDYGLAHDRLKNVQHIGIERLALLTGKVDHYRQRSLMREPGTWRLPIVLREAWGGNYHRFSRGWKAVVQDLLLR